MSAKDDFCPPSGTINFAVRITIESHGEWKLNPQTINEFLSHIELFRDFDSKEREAFVAVIESVDLEPETVLFEENEPRHNLYIVYKGEIELYKRTSFGDTKRLLLFRQADFLGEGALMDDYPHATSARAVADTTLFAISRARFMTLCQTQPTIGMKFLSRVARVISRRMRQASTGVVNVAEQYVSGKMRTEHDLLGERDVPSDAYYGVQTLRALENFNISGVSLTQYPVFINSLAMVKLAAARANLELDMLPAQFVVDMIQGGAGTSTNMNANEVIANRALEILEYQRGDYTHCHPNNHVNLSQSTNDAYPTSLKIALIKANESLIDVLRLLAASFHRKAQEFREILKIGRTQLQDAVPMTLGQEFEAYAVTLEEEIDRLIQNVNLFLEVNMGGTAIGTGINADPEFSRTVIKHLREITGLDIKLAYNLVEATQDTGAFVMYSSATKRLAVKLSKICNDLRLLSSGPRAGINEINLPPMQPGSSIMPGKVNPVIPEVVNQIAFKVIGNDLTVTLAAEAGQLELNVMEPVIAQSLFESIEMLKNGMLTLKYRCIDGITANEEQCRRLVENSIGLVTALNPVLGYEMSSSLAKEALKTGRGVYELVLEKNLLTREELGRLLAPENMIRPGRSGKKK